MKVLVFGASGMVGRGVLRECLLDPRVERVVSIGRSSLGLQDAKLREVVHCDLMDLAPIERERQGFDACFSCLGVSSAGMSESAYRRITFDLTLAVARTLAHRNPSMTFVYVSGAGTGTSEHGRTMWTRVKGATENALLDLPLRAPYMFRPGLIEPLHGIESKTASYRMPYKWVAPVLPPLRILLPKYVTTTEQVGRAMLRVAHDGAPKRILEGADINALCDRPRRRGRRRRSTGLVFGPLVVAHLRVVCPQGANVGRLDAADLLVGGRVGLPDDLPANGEVAALLAREIPGDQLLVDVTKAGDGVGQVLHDINLPVRVGDLVDHLALRLCGVLHRSSSPRFSSPERAALTQGAVREV